MKATNYELYECNVRHLALIQSIHDCTVQEATELAFNWLLSNIDKHPTNIPHEIHKEYPRPRSKKIKVRHSAEFDQLVSEVSKEPVFKHTLGKNDTARKVRTALVLFAEYGLCSPSDKQLPLDF